MDELFAAVYWGVKSALKARASAPDSVDAAISRMQDAIGASRVAVDRVAAHSPVRRFNPQAHDAFRPQTPAQSAASNARVKRYRETQAAAERLGQTFAEHPEYRWIDSAHAELPPPWQTMHMLDHLPFLPNRDVAAQLTVDGWLRGDLGGFAQNFPPRYALGQE